MKEYILRVTWTWQHGFLPDGTHPQESFETEPMEIEELLDHIDGCGGAAPFNWDCDAWWEEERYIDPATREPVNNLHIWWSDYKDDEKTRSNTRIVLDTEDGELLVMRHTCWLELTPEELTNYAHYVYEAMRPGAVCAVEIIEHKPEKSE